jgi:hypothetical protein
LTFCGPGAAVDQGGVVEGAEGVSEATPRRCRWVTTPVSPHLHVLDEVQPRLALPVREQHREERRRRLDAVLQDVAQHRDEPLKVHHQMLLLPHGAEGRRVQRRRVVEEQVVLVGEFDAHGGRRAGAGAIVPHEHLHHDRLQRADVLRRLLVRLQPDLQRHLRTPKRRGRSSTGVACRRRRSNKRGDARLTNVVALPRAQ